MSGAENNVERSSTSPVLDPAAVDVTEEALRPVPGKKVARSLGAAGLTPDGRLRSGRLAGLTMKGAVWVLYWPIVLESLLTSLVGMTDTYLSAQISVHATDAIGGASYLIWFIGLVVMAVGVGATAVISRSVGAGRFAAANAAVGQTVLLATGAGIMVGALIAAAAPGAARLMSMSPEAATAFTQYVRIVAIGVPFISVLSSMTACARGAGDSFRPLLAMVIVNVVNIVVSWVLSGVDLAQTRLEDGELVRHVFLENPFSLDMGVRGIALGTIIAEAIGMLVVVAMLVRGVGGVGRVGSEGGRNGKGVVRLRAKRLKPHWHTMRRLLRIGLPSFLETFGMWIGNFAVILLVGMMGKEAILGSHIIAVRLEAFSFGPGFAMAMVSSILAGQYLGAGSALMARRVIVFATIVASVQMGLMGIVFSTLGREVTGLISSQPEHLRMVPALLFWAGLVQVPFAIGIVLRVGMRGAGDAKWAMWLTWVSTYGVRLPLVYFLSGIDITLPGWLGGVTIVNPSPVGGTLEWIWIGFGIEIIIRAAMFGARFLHGGWTRARV